MAANARGCLRPILRIEEKEMALSAKTKSEIVSEFQVKEGDTGSPEVQVA